MVTDYPTAAFQVLIFAAGIHLFLRFVRTTRGNRLIRGLFISVLVGFVGLFGLAGLLKLEELEHLLEVSTGYIVVAFAVVFQNELRRGIAQLGEHSFIGGGPGSASEDTRAQIVQALKNLARQRVGALIVLERETPLTPYMETGTAFDAEVQAPLLENLFHPGAALHDGAVILRGDRVAAAGCILPLTQDPLSPTLGTRHRAALGMAEESDAVILIVSEEKGTISIAHRGSLNVDLPAEDIEQEISSRLDVERVSAGKASLGLISATLGGLRRDIAWLPGSILLGLGVWVLAHRNIETTRPFQVVLVDAGEAGQRTPEPGELVVILPSENMRLSAPPSGTELSVSVKGTRGRLDKLSGAVRGIVEIPQDWTFGSLEASEVKWEDPVGGLEYNWATGPPTIAVEAYGTKTFTLDSSYFELDLSDLNPRYQADLERISFEPNPTIEIAGAESRLNGLALDGPYELRFEPIKIKKDVQEFQRQRIRLAAALEKKGFSLAPEYSGHAIVPVVPVTQTVGTVELEIALVCMDTERQEELANWSLPPSAQTARFSIETYGLIPQDADNSSPAMIEKVGQIKRIVTENLKVFVDVAELAPTGEGRSASIHWYWSRDWKDAIDSLKLETENLGGREELTVRLESEREVLLLALRANRDPTARPGGENL